MNNPFQLQPNGVSNESDLFKLRWTMAREEPKPYGILGVYNMFWTVSVGTQLSTVGVRGGEHQMACSWMGIHGYTPLRKSKCVCYVSDYVRCALHCILKALEMSHLHIKKSSMVAKWSFGTHSEALDVGEEQGSSNESWIMFRHAFPLIVFYPIWDITNTDKLFLLTRSMHIISASLK